MTILLKNPMMPRRRKRMCSMPTSTPPTLTQSTSISFTDHHFIHNPNPILFMTDFFKSLYKRIVAFMNAPVMRRPMAMMLTLLLCAANPHAAGNGLAGINEATSMMTSYFDPATKLIYAIGAVVESYRRCQGLWQVQLRRSRHIENRRLMVRCLYIPCGSRHNPSLFSSSKSATSMEYSINKGHRQDGGIQGAESPVPVHLRRRSDNRFHSVRGTLYVRCTAGSVHRLRCCERVGSGVVHLPP